MIHNPAIRPLFRSILFILAACAGAAGFQPPAMAATDMREPLAAILVPEEAPIPSSALEQRLIQEGLVDVRSLDPDIRVDLKYAQADNFMGMNVYGELRGAYLRPQAARKLVKANQILRERHPDLCILVVDALRPRSIQHKMWKIVAGTPMQPYVANPYYGSMHNFGAAVDVTLYNEKIDERLDMGTPIDFFGPMAQPRLEARYSREGKLSERQVENRLILRDAMRAAGWHVLNIEWWHFNAFPRDHIRRTYTIIE